MSCPLLSVWREFYFSTTPEVELRREIIMENWEWIVDIFCAAVDVVISYETIRSDVLIS